MQITLYILQHKFCLMFEIFGVKIIFSDCMAILNVQQHRLFLKLDVMVCGLTGEKHRSKSSYLSVGL